MKIRVEEYIRPDGSIPYKEWFDSLDAQAAAKVATAKIRMELGNTSNVKWFAGIGEYVIDWGPGYRIYLAKDGESLIVLFGAAPSGAKRRQQGDNQNPPAPCRCAFLAGMMLDCDPRRLAAARAKVSLLKGAAGAVWAICCRRGDRDGAHGAGPRAFFFVPG